MRTKKPRRFSYKPLYYDKEKEAFKKRIAHLVSDKEAKERGEYRPQSIKFRRRFKRKQYNYNWFLSSKSAIMLELVLGMAFSLFLYYREKYIEAIVVLVSTYVLYRFFTIKKKQEDRNKNL